MIQSWEGYDHAKDKVLAFTYLVLMLLTTTALILIIMVKLAKAETFTYDELADAIYHAEGGTGASVPYGIFYDGCTWDDPDLCRKICLNTIRNNTGRFTAQYEYKDYLDFLASRYCPVGSETDNGTCRFWKKNVKWFLDHPKPVEYRR